MALQDHAIGRCFFDGNPLTEVTSLERTTESGQQRIDTLEGLAGFSPGPGSVSCTIGYAIPIGGTEDEFQEKCVDGAYVMIQLGWGPKAYVGIGKIITDKTSQSATAAAEGSFDWVGEFKKIE
jgi:hypothetical protein